MNSDDINLTCDVLYAKGLLLSHDLNNPKEAADCFLIIVNKYPDNALVVFAENELMLLGYDIKKEIKEKVVDGSLDFSASNYPNPFNPTTTIKYSLPSNEHVTIKVYDMLGREITTLVNEVKQAGEFSVIFNASHLASGIYLYTITAGKFTRTSKLLLTK